MLILIQSVCFIALSIVILVLCKSERYHKRLRKTKSEEETTRIVKMLRIGGTLLLIGSVIALFATIL